MLHGVCNILEAGVLDECFWGKKAAMAKTNYTHMFFRVSVKKAFYFPPIWTISGCGYTRHFSHHLHPVILNATVRMFSFLGWILIRLGFIMHEHHRFSARYLRSDIWFYLYWLGGVFGISRSLWSTCALPCIEFMQPRFNIL